MREEYDFSNGERGKFYRPDAKLNIPIYLEKKVSEFIGKLAAQKGVDQSSIVNELLRDGMKSTIRRMGK